MLLLLQRPVVFAQPALKKLTSPILFKGDEKTAYRDPAAIFYRHKVYLFFTLCEINNNGQIFSYTAMSTSADLKNWSPVKKLTPANQNLNYSSPGNIIRYNNEWIMCLQTYPRPGNTTADMPRFGNANSRLYTMRSKDLEHWSLPELMKVKGDTVPFENMGRMIDPYLLEDKDEKGKWWCFYKQNGVSRSYSHDLQHWTYAGHAESGENACVLIRDNQYFIINSPVNGISIKTSTDLKNWQNFGPILTFGQQQWDWAKGRLTGGFVIDALHEPTFKNYLMFFHGSGPLTEEKGDFDKNASIAIAWSKDLLNWEWPGKL